MKENTNDNHKLIPQITYKHQLAKIYKTKQKQNQPINTNPLILPISRNHRTQKSHQLIKTSIGRISESVKKFKKEKKHKSD